MILRETKNHQYSINKRDFIEGKESMNRLNMKQATLLINFSKRKPNDVKIVNTISNLLSFE